MDTSDMPANTLPRLHDAAAEGDLDAVKVLTPTEN